MLALALAVPLVLLLALALVLVLVPLVVSYSRSTMKRIGPSNPTSSLSNSTVSRPPIPVESSMSV